VPHHVTQRGNHREPVFFDPGDCEAYLDLLHEHGHRETLEIFAYCLMPNHVHLIVVPPSAACMSRGMQAVHSLYAQRVNRMKKAVGHLWQGRFYSAPLDANHFTNGIRYVERNPVAAALVSRAEDYRWSSAAAHCGLRRDRVLQPAGKSTVLSGIANWSRWLAEGVPDGFGELLRRNTRLGLPCGSPDFIEELEKSTGRDLTYRPWGGLRGKRRAA
jgi:putative transposase